MAGRKPMDFTRTDPVLRRLWPTTKPWRVLEEATGVSHETLRRRARELDLGKRPRSERTARAPLGTGGLRAGLRPDDPGCGDAGDRRYEASVRASTRSLAKAIARAYPAYVAGLASRGVRA